MRPPPSTPTSRSVRTHPCFDGLRGVASVGAWGCRCPTQRTRLWQSHRLTERGSSRRSATVCVKLGGYMTVRRAAHTFTYLCLSRYAHAAIGIATYDLQGPASCVVGMDDARWPRPAHNFECSYIRCVYSVWSDRGLPGLWDSSLFCCYLYSCIQGSSEDGAVCGDGSHRPPYPASAVTRHSIFRGFLPPCTETHDTPLMTSLTDTEGLRSPHERQSRRTPLSTPRTPDSFALTPQIPVEETSHGPRAPRAARVALPSSSTQSVGNRNSNHEDTARVTARTHIPGTCTSAVQYT